MFRDELLVADASALFTGVRESLEATASSWEDVPLFDDPLY